MQDTKQLLQDACADLENWMDRNDSKHYKHFVTLFSGPKPEDYWLPQMHIGTTASISDELLMAWYGEIKVDGVVVVRKSRVPNEGEKLEDMEELVLSAIVYDMVGLGIEAAQKSIEAFRKYRTCN